jgi:hypothetical protein
MVDEHMVTGLQAGYLLDRLWHLMRGEEDRSKRLALLSLAAVLEESGIATR